MTPEAYKQKRAEAEATVRPLIIQFAQYQGVQLDEIAKLLSVEQYAKLIDDPIRGIGPTRDSIYPWNVIDYLMEEPKKEEVDIMPLERNKTVRELELKRMAQQSIPQHTGQYFNNLRPE